MQLLYFLFSKLDERNEVNIFCDFQGEWRRHLLADDDRNPDTGLSPFTNCTPPAIEEFPRPLIPQYIRVKGGLVVHLLVSAYMFLGLSIVCDDYFVPALERMVECKLFCSYF